MSVDVDMCVRVRVSVVDMCVRVRVSVVGGRWAGRSARQSWSVGGSSPKSKNPTQ